MSDRHVCEHHRRECYTKADAGRAAARMTRQRKGEVVIQKCSLEWLLPATAGKFHLVGPGARDQSVVPPGTSERPYKPEDISPLG